MRNKRKWYSILLLGLAILLAISEIGCTSAIDKYKSDVASILAQHSSAWTKYNELVEEHNQLDFASLTQSEFKDMIQEELSGADDMYKLSNDAYHKLTNIRPPMELQEAHATLVKSLDLTTQGYLELRSYLEQVYKTGKSDTKTQKKANELLIEADRLWQQATDEINKHK